MRMRVDQSEAANMEVFVSAPSFRFSNLVFIGGSVVGDVLNQIVQNQRASPSDFYVTKNGRPSPLEDPLQHGAVYHLEPRLCGGKGGFGSMLRALGAQIEKTTNREACRDLSGRRLRDVNHEKEMAEWLKKQADREAEKEQRRLERLQKKLAEPKHQFTDPEFQQQCHDLSERLEDSVLKGLQVSSSGLVKVDDVSTAKRPNPNQSQQQQKKRKMGSAAAACSWMGLDELLSSEEDEDPLSASSSSCEGPAVAMMAHKEEAEPEQSSCSTNNTCTDCPPKPTQDQKPAEASTDQTIRPSDESKCSEPPLACLRLHLSSVATVDQLESLGLDVLKQELMSRGLKCGGTLSERAARLYSIKGLSPDQIDPALLAKPEKSKK
ncbi:splicing regulator SDE2 [Betta splendens]|uniref:Replication stress response regulator SDE2 n=1 Tax=Betta splendens TaxID=158456 RepID=A0A6P7MTW5_BETSP|nr:splicing regulator SDE2 [Betta splendens]